MHYPKGTRWRVIVEGVRWGGIRPHRFGGFGIGGELVDPI